MALLQISEPGLSPDQGGAVGIDLGTTNSLVATVRSGVPVVLPDSHGRPLLPSIVRYLPDGRFEVGYAARRARPTIPKNTIVSVKRYMGRGIKDVAHIEHAVRLRRRARDAADPHRCRRQEPGLSSEIRVLRERAELSLQGNIFGAVITVPAISTRSARRPRTRGASPA